MRIVRDEPERLLAIEGEGDAPRLPEGLVGGLVGSFLGIADPEGLWHASSIRADREAGILEIVETNFANGETRTSAIALASVLGLNVRNRFWRHPSTKDHPKTTPGADGIDLIFRFDEAASPPSRSIWIRLDGVDSREKVADFAFRLGGAIGLSHQRVVKSDPRRIQIDMVAAAAPAMEPMPAISNRAAYSRNDVISEARSAAMSEIIPPFDPAQFRNEVKLTYWRLGDEVRLEKPLDRTSFGCVPFVIGGLVIGPLLAAFEIPLLETLAFGTVGLLAASLSGYLIWAWGPKRTLISWRERTIAIKGWTTWRRFSFDDLGAIEIKCIRTFISRKNYSDNFYECSVLAHFRSEPKPVALVNSGNFTRDPEAPYDLILPLATELAQALGTERRVTEYN